MIWHFGCTFSLARVSSSQVHEEETVQAISYKAIQGWSPILLIPLHPLSSKTPMMKPSQPDVSCLRVNQNTVKIDNPQVVMDGVRQRLSNRRDRTKPEETDIVDLPARWSTWTKA